jgi:hypothetical protein
MAIQQSITPGSAVATDHKFRDMSGGQKIVFVCKLVVFLCTFGFVFPTLLTD